MLKVTIGNLAIIEEEVFETYDEYDKETGDWIGEYQEREMGFAENPLSLGQIIMDKDKGDCIWDKDFCAGALDNLPNVVQAKFYFICTSKGVMALAELTVDYDELSQEQLELLRQDVLGQFSDGWGESFEQWPVKIDGNEYYFKAHNPSDLPKILEVVKI